MDKAEKLVEFKKLAADAERKVYIDRFDENVRVIILRGPASLCAYLGIPVDHPLAGSHYDDLRVECNGGLTYGKEGGEGKYLPAGYFWYGWDYCHCDDLAFYDVRDGEPQAYKMKSKPWLVADVEGEMWYAVYTLKKLMKVAENAFAKGAKWREAATAK